MPKPAAIAATLILCTIATLPWPPARAQATSTRTAGLTEGRRLAAIYDTILDARFDDARRELATACPPAPSAACDALREVAQWWEIQQNQWSQSLDARMESSASTAIASATAWTKREPERAEAWFYLAGAYAPLSQWRVLRGERLTAARDGKRIKDALERALALDASLQDAWFGIGLYHYYADVAPAALKLLRFLLLLPGGDRREGLAEMLRARAGGILLRGEADYQLHWLYLWYEEQPERARDLLRALDAQHPSNPLFLQRLADVEHVYFSDHAASADAWQRLLDRATTGRARTASLASARATVGLAAESIELGAPARAIERLTPLIATRPSTPYGILALAYVTLGDAYAASNDRPHASDAYTRAIADAPRDDPDRIRDRAREALARVRSAR
ncbi:MAG: hypothetical protein QM736_29075 [Vicinamibacterales bacterium]